MQLYFLSKPALFKLGFRIFFLSATSTAVVAMLLWLLSYASVLQLETGKLSIFYWHGHEMVFGYAMAVVAGFLLTAMQNWTNIPMPRGWALAAIWLPWLAARLMFSAYPHMQSVAHGLDVIFMLLLLHPIALAVIQAQQWRQVGVLSKLLLLLIAKLMFWAGALGYADFGLKTGLYLGVFMLMSLVLTIGRRVLPFFIERGVGYAVHLHNSRLKDGLALVTFLLFCLMELLYAGAAPASGLALAAAAAQAWRLYGWYTPGIWRRPLLWSLYLAWVTVILSLLLYALRLWWPVSHALALHGFTVGGIGLITLSMMGRVSLGHTGRDIHQPPLALVVAMVLMLLAFIFRVLLPLLGPEHYFWYVVLAQCCWTLAFFLLLISYGRVWMSARVDGKEG